MFLHTFGRPFLSYSLSENEEYQHMGETVQIKDKLMLCASEAVALAQNFLGDE